MNQVSVRNLATAFTLVGWLMTACVSQALADGTGILLQRQGDRLVLGFDTGSSGPGSQGLGGRAFGGIVSRAESSTQEPSFLSLSTPPTGSEVLPFGAAVHWDFLPITTGGATANLMHWDGQGDPALEPADNATLTLFDPSFNAAIVDGEAEAVPGLRLGTTRDDSPLTLHSHRLWFLSGPSFSPVAEGVYVAALRARMPGLTPTEPFFVALGTPDTDNAVFNAAVPWLNANADSLLLSGDYNFDGLVDGADYAVWADQFGATTPQPVDLGEADGNGDGVIDAADYTLWRDAIAVPPATAVPEPGAAVLLMAAVSATVTGHRVSRRSRPAVHA